MSAELGILFAFFSLVCWGLGDFLIQKTTRKIGDWEALFIITAIGAVILLPFVTNEIRALFSFQDETFIILLGMSSVLLMASMLDFEALKKGKIAIVEPVLALEVPITAFIAFAVVNEGLQALEIFLIVLLMIGLALISLKSHHFKRRIWLERGVLLTAVAAILMGIANFLVGFSSRLTTPLFANWFINVFVSVICLFYIIANKRTTKMVHDFGKNKELVLGMSLFDNFAWIAFAIATTYIPIAIAIALSESYIALAALLGLLINREILMRHQKIGLITAIGSAIVLSLVVI